MGQAKNRGTLEERKAEAIKREESPAKQPQSTATALRRGPGSAAFSALAVAALMASSQMAIRSAKKGRGGKS